MATSNGLWSSPAVRWTTSTKNLVGLGLAVVAVGAHLLVGLGVLWPVIVVASYSVGALLAPRDRVGLHLDLGARPSAAQLAEQLHVFARKLPSGRLDLALRARLDEVIGNLEQVVASWDKLAGAPEQQQMITAMITDYLPTSVETYLNLPRALTTGTGVRRDAHDELLDQLGILAAESARVRDAVYARTVEALANQGQFLRDKFRRSGLDLGPGGS
ncbi:MAG: hypothetical protein FWF21_03355 [Micrococcales bacterium]|nr:hypothetical protein [Micrococcales bacterium]